MTPHDDKLEFLLCEYLDGRLGADEARRVEEMLAAAPALREQLRLLGRVDECLKAQAGSVEEIDLPAQRAEIMSAIERKALFAAPSRRVLVFPRVVKVLAAAAMVLVAVSASFLFYSGRHRPAAAPRIDVSLVSASPARALKAGGEVLKISLVRPSGAGAAPLPEPPELAGGTSEGTVVASVGTETDDSDNTWDVTPLAMFGT
jgi:anti-sigma factor RsiW